MRDTITNIITIIENTSPPNSNAFGKGRLIRTQPNGSF